MDQIGVPSPFDAIRRFDGDGREFWSARDLLALCAYTGGAAWTNFEKAIRRAMSAARNTGASTDVIFTEVEENPTGLGGRPRRDYRLTRLAAYLTVMNCDPDKPEVAGAQNYFAIKTREAEVVPTRRQTHLETARELVATIEREEALKQQVEIQAAQIKDRDDRLMITAAPAAAYRRFMAADGTFSVGDAAKYLYVGAQVKTGRNRLFQRLRDLGWIYDETPRRSRNSWHVAQKGMESGYVMQRPTGSFTDPVTSEQRQGDPQIRIFLKGLDWLMMHPERISRDPQDVLPGL